MIADGMDFFDVFEKAGEALARARAGDGPTLLECKTYRYFGHYVGDNLGRTVGEGWLERGDLRGIDGDVAALCVDLGFDLLDAPVKRVTAPHGLAAVREMG
jgi:hypothetical protein